MIKIGLTSHETMNVQKLAAYFSWTTRYNTLPVNAATLHTGLHSEKLKVVHWSYATGI